MITTSYNKLYFNYNNYNKLYFNYNNYDKLYCNYNNYNKLYVLIDIQKPMCVNLLCI